MFFLGSLEESCRLALALPRKPFNASKKRSKHDAPKYITLTELERAEKEILKHVQGRAFPEELNYPIKTVKKSSRLYKLDPHVKDGLLCVGGRLRNASLPSETKNQIILNLPKEDHVTKLIIYDYHSICGHSGREHVLALRASLCKILISSFAHKIFGFRS